MEIRIPIAYMEIVDEITTFTSLSRQDVENRVWMESLEPGWNVVRDAARFSVTPHRFDDHMAQLYHESDGFIFESMVYWAKPSRQRWTQQALDRIRVHMKAAGITNGTIRVLMLGDGTGNDSLYLAANGLVVDYFDVPGSKTAVFAKERFGHYGLLGGAVRPIDDYAMCLTPQYDVVLSFEVLEHLPDPLTAINDIARMLKPGGIALITEAFDWIAPQVPTHLASNERFAGRTPFLFLDNGLRLSWYNSEEPFKPTEYTRVEATTRMDRLKLWKERDVRRSYALARFNVLLDRTKQLRNRLPV